MEHTEYYTINGEKMRIRYGEGDMSQMSDRQLQIEILKELRGQSRNKTTMITERLDRKTKVLYVMLCITIIVIETIIEIARAYN